MPRLSIPDEQTHATFTVTTSTSAFPISFSLFEKADLRVSVDGEELDQSDFSFTGTRLDGGGYDGGTVTLNNAVDDVEVIIWRHVAPVRASNFAPSASVPVQSVDQAFNRLTAVGQDLHYLKLDAPKNPTAGSYLAYDASGNITTSSGTGADAGLRTDLAAASGTSLIGYDDGQTGADPVDMQTFMQSLPINAVAYGFVPDGTDRGAEFAAALNAAIASDRELYIPAGSYRIDSGVTLYLTEAVPGYSVFRKGVRIRGAGSGQTIIDSRVASGWLLDISVGDGAGGEHDFASYRGVIGGYIEGLTIRNGVATTASNGIRLRSVLRFSFRDLHVFGLSGTAFKLKCTEGDLDGSNQVSWDGVRVENCAGWGVDAGCDAGHNENSFSVFRRCFFQNCGTTEKKTITGITQANPGVVTCVGHGFTTGQRIFIGGITSGMTQVNSPDAGASYVVTVINANSFSIGVNTTSYSAYTSGGWAFPRTPTSGGTRIKGQITSFYECGWTINPNRSVWIDGDGGGLPQDVFFYSSTIENPQLIGLHVMGCRTVIANGLHLYTNAAGSPIIWGHLYDGETATTTDIRINGACVRSTTAENAYTAFQTIGANADADTIRIDTASLHVKQFGATGQTLFRNIVFDPIPQQCRLAAINATEVQLRMDPADSRGNIMPIRATNGGASGSQHTGAWTPCAIGPDSITLTNAGLSASTTYNVYLYAANTVLNSPMLEASTTAPVLDSTGYMVKIGDATRLWVGRVRTDGAGQFITTGGAFLNPLRVPSGQVGVSASMWVSETDRKLYYKGGSLPSSEAGGDYSYWAKFEASTAFDPPSLAPGDETTTDVTITSGAGDYGGAVALSSGWGGLVALGTMKAANNVMVWIRCPSNAGSAIDLAAGTLRPSYQRR